LNYTRQGQQQRRDFETGVLQKAAIGLYESFGYCQIQPFGSYLDDPLSLFMETHLVPSALA
jgi:hypothetical protein